MGGGGSMGRRKRRSLRRRSEGKEFEMMGDASEHTDVANKSADMFS